jgi:hypothetical protein
LEFGFNNPLITKALIRTTIKKALSDIQRDPKRSVRNLVDLGLQFADGENQRQILDVTRTYLSSENSAYFRLAENIVNEIDHEKLTEYGINFGYNGCTLGAKLIRENEVKLGFHIPFLLAFNVTNAEDGITVDEIRKTIRQGMPLGIYIYVLICSCDNYGELLDMADEFSECAFVFFVNPRRLTREVISRTSELNNLVTSVRFDSDNSAYCSEKVRQMREQGCITCLHYRYSPENLNELLAGNTVDSLAETGAIAAILYAEPGIDPAAQRLVFDYKTETVRSQQYPIFMFEARSDIYSIEHMFSNAECLVVFSDGGKVYYTSSLKTLDGVTLGDNSLNEILGTIEL